ncbi:MAG: flagellar hook-associated protein FlgL [Sphingomonadales bacterium]|nr:flagellar hook-associated protein FlgL [Sphingomonadales bacterium]MDE2569034.1 flagellar hook-associated protein FlgL [Sphingomonadales bacterium]
MIGFNNATSAFYDRSIGDLTSLRKSAEGLQQQISSGQKLAKSSDDPVAAARLRTLARADTLTAVDQSNTDSAQTDLNLTDGVLSDLVTAVSRAQTLATQAASGTLTDAQRAAIGSEIGQIHDQVLQLANSRDGSGNALFGGQTAGAAYTLDSSGNAVYAGTASAGQVQLGEGQTVTRAMTGSQVFGGDGTSTPDLLSTLKTLADALQGGSTNPQGAAQSALSALSSGFDTITTAQTVVGARLNFIDLANQHRQSVSDLRASEQSAIGGTDITGAVARLQQTMLVLQASQASFTRLASLSLFNALG